MLERNFASYAKLVWCRQKLLKSPPMEEYGKGKGKENGKEGKKSRLEVVTSGIARWIDGLMDGWVSKLRR